MEIMVDLMITVFAYMVYPLVKYKVIEKNKEYDNKAINKTLILNSVIVAIIFLIIQYNMYGDNAKISFAPAFLYYCINSAIYLKKGVIKNTKPTKTNTIAKYIVIIGGGFLLLCIVVGFLLSLTNS